MGIDERLKRGEFTGKQVGCGHARARHYQKRGGDAVKVTFDEALVVTSEPGTDFVAIDDALEALARFDERKSRVIEMRFFGGLTVEETATV